VPDDAPAEDPAEEPPIPVFPRGREVEPGAPADAEEASSWLSATATPSACGPAHSKPAATAAAPVRETFDEIVMSDFFRTEYAGMEATLAVRPTLNRIPIETNP